MATLSVILFLGGWWASIFSLFNAGLFIELISLGLKISLILFVFIWVRAAFPRYRYDQLMRLGWKSFLPLSLGWVIAISGILLGLNALPQNI